MCTASLTRRGYGARRVVENLRAAGIEESEREEAHRQAERKKWQAAETFARKRRIGPYASQAADRDLQQKQIAAFLRAGHDFELTRRYVGAGPGEHVGEEGEWRSAERRVGKECVRACSIRGPPNQSKKKQPTTQPTG